MEQQILKLHKVSTGTVVLQYSMDDFSLFRTRTRRTKETVLGGQHSWKDPQPVHMKACGQPIRSRQQQNNVKVSHENKSLVNLF